jgi:hypothetical protein
MSRLPCVSNYPCRWKDPGTSTLTCPVCYPFYLPTTIGTYSSTAGSVIYSSPESNIEEVCLISSLIKIYFHIFPKANPCRRKSDRHRRRGNPGYKEDLLVYIYIIHFISDVDNKYVLFL